MLHWHVIPQVVPVDLAYQQAHGLDLELKAPAPIVLTYWRLVTSLTQSNSAVVDPH